MSEINRDLSLKLQRGMLSLLISCVDEINRAIKSGIEPPARAVDLIQHFIPPMKDKTFLEASPAPANGMTQLERIVYEIAHGKVSTETGLAVAERLQVINARERVLTGDAPRIINEPEGDRALRGVLE